ncbi:Uncharacterized protein FWK35_00033651 [Aphis craccivora]|uniref:Uncharacterized protein n=1 Tax=Aphis craccivora TaxID=307492 RepID=A0A6G0YUA3_APHCR|nr:Uncharacterized protein FWK35_00033651 [Aphis craccivora]
MTLVDRVPRKLAEPIIRDRFIAFVHVVGTSYGGRKDEVGNIIEENSTVRRNFVNCILPAARVGKQKTASSVKFELGKRRRKNGKNIEKKNNTHPSI